MSCARLGIGHDPMKLTTLQPSAPLRENVETLWYFAAEAQSHAQERALPGGTLDLVIDLRGSSRREATCTVVGPHNRYFLLDTTTAIEVVGIHFAPGGALPFLGLPAHELENQCVPPEDLWGASVYTELRDRLLELDGAARRMRELERFVLERRSDRWRRHPAVSSALRSFRRVPHARTVGEVTEAVGLSSTRFIDLFKREIGMTPKLYCRVERFQAALRQIEEGEGEPHWADLAFACGYSDQAHMVREFRAFSGCSPTEYLVRRTSKLNHLRHDRPEGLDRGA